ncbi:MAG: hypothetical protein HZB16_14780 [Armatimonadetes bacterium]|nr:hypothetical protein [Armatimonadota bacterium]
MDASYEFVATALFTSAVWFALPRPLRQPLLCDQSLPPASPPHVRLRPRRLNADATRWLVALASGLSAALVIGAGLHVTLPGTQIMVDPRETLVTLGAALSGPWPALLIGVLAGSLEPMSGLTATSMAMHCAGALAVALAYRRLAARCATDLRLLPFLARWCGLVLLYYLAILLPISLAYLWAHPAVVQRVLGAPRLTGTSAALVAAAMLPECAVTCLLTVVAWWAMPRRARRPIGAA